MANGVGDSKDPDSFETILSDVVREELEKQFGSKSKTPWSPEGYTPQSSFGVTVPKTYDEVLVETGTLRGVIAASDPTSAFYASRRQPSDVPNFYALPANERNLFEIAAKAVHPLKTGQSYYEDLTSASWDLSTKGIYKSPQQLAYEAYVDGEGVSEKDGGGGGRGAAYAGPRTTVTMASERDLRTTADAVASTVLGRAVTDEEFQSVLEQVRSAERAEPTITTSGVGSTVTQAGLTAEGRQNIITEALMQGPEAEEFGKATKMMDLFYSALEARPEGA